MKTTTKTQLPRDYYNRPLTSLLGLDWIELPPECRVGSFSKAATKAHVSPTDAVADFLSRPRPTGDCLLRTNWDGRWQVFERRIVIGTRLTASGDDTYGKKGPCGTGRLFIQ